MIKIIHIDNFFNSNELQSLAAAVDNLPFVEKEYGQEIDQFNMVHPELSSIIHIATNLDVMVDEENSGIFRKPYNFIHFESFNHVTDWVFAVSLENTTFNVYENIKEGAENALDKYALNYRKLFDWDVVSNILLKPNQCVIFRPWLFHSFVGGIMQLYRLTDRNVDA